MLALLKADARRIPLADGSVQCVVTSPPYWGLRKYSGEQELVWGDWRGAYGLEPTVEMYVQHTVEIFHEIRRVLRYDGVCFLNVADSYASKPMQKMWQANPFWDSESERDVLGLLHEGVQETVLEELGECSQREEEGKGLLPEEQGRDAAKRESSTTGSQIGSDTGLRRTVPVLRGDRAEVFDARSYRREGEAGAKDVQRNLRDISQPAEQGVPEKSASDSLLELQLRHRSVVDMSTSGIKTKDLCLIPQRLAIALQNDGWWIRSDIIWAKPNAMPESVTDRPTRSHEYILMLTKSASYFWDRDAVREPHLESSLGRYKYPFKQTQPAWREENYPGLKGEAKMNHVIHADGRNIRSVWTFTTEAYPEAHFSTFPEELPKRCILAATSAKGACAKCGTLWERVVNKTRTFESGSGRSGNLPSGKNGPNLQGGGETVDIRRGPVVHCETVGWHPGCECGIDETVPCLVLDPFAGSGTVGKVAIELGRRAVLCDLAYQDLASKRTAAIQRPLLEGRL